MANKSTTMLLKLVVLALSVVFFVSMVEGNRLFGSTSAVGFSKAKSAPTCSIVFGVGEGDTCFSITQQLDLSTEFFNALNPNLVCDKLFVGQWLCVSGTA